jgi:hypothetical protein
VGLRTFLTADDRVEKVAAFARVMHPLDALLTRLGQLFRFAMYLPDYHVERCGPLTFRNSVASPAVRVFRGQLL